MKFFYIILLVCLFSCNQDKHIKRYSITKLEEVSKNKNFSKNNIKKSFNWIVPDYWTEGKKSSMRLASYSIPYDGKVADVSITNFSGDGGGLLLNINRWRKQLGLEAISIEVLENNIEVKESNLGNYKYIKIINVNNKDTAFLCSIMQIENNTIFVKLNSTIEGVQLLENEFINFCSSFN